MPPGEPARINLASSTILSQGFRKLDFLSLSLSRIKENSALKRGLFGMIKIFREKFSVESSRKFALTSSHRPLFTFPKADPSTMEHGTVGLAS